VRLALWKSFSYDLAELVTLRGKMSRLTGILKNCILWDIMSSIPLSVNRRLRRRYLSLHCLTISQARNQLETGSKQSSVLCLAYFPNLKMDSTYSCEKLVEFQRVRDVIFQKIQLFTSTVGRTSNNLAS
jgi:hypothetical protein